MNMNTTISGRVVCCDEVPLCGDRGFGLIELMMAMTIALFLVGSLYSAYISQQQTKIAQDQVAEMQRNARAALEVMTAEIRMAGFDPTGSSGAGIVAASKGRLQFTRDMNDNGVGSTPGDGDTGDENENITYGFRAESDSNQDGVVDAGVASLGRNTGGSFMQMAENIQAIEFLYLVGDKLQPTLSPTAADFDDIRAVTITVLARAANPDQQFVNPTVNYTPGSNAIGWPGNGAANDHYRRRLYTTTVKIRNMGL